MVKAERCFLRGDTGDRQTDVHMPGVEQIPASLPMLNAQFGGFCRPGPAAITHHPENRCVFAHAVSCASALRQFVYRCRLPSAAAPIRAVAYSKCGTDGQQ